MGSLDSTGTYMVNSMMRKFVTSKLDSLCKTDCLFPVWKYFWLTIETKTNRTKNWVSQKNCLLTRELIPLDGLVQTTCRLIGEFDPLDWFSQARCLGMFKSNLKKLSVFEMKENKWQLVIWLVGNSFLGRDLISWLLIPFLVFLYNVQCFE